MKENNIKPKQYKIDTFDKLMNLVNDETVEKLSVDLALWLAWCNGIISNYRKANPDKCIGKKNSDIIKCCFIWVDDGKHDILGSVLENTDTGEITEINTKS